MATTKQLVEELRSRGYIVGYYTRKEGGIRITQIGTETFSPRLSQGNARARQILEKPLSAWRQKTLIQSSKTISETRKKTIIATKGVGLARAPRKRAVAVRTPLPDTVRKKLANVQREWREKVKGTNLEESRGKITTKNVRWIMENKSEKEALDYLDRAKRYANKIAYVESVIALRDDMRNFNNVAGEVLIDMCVQRLNSAIENEARNFKFDDLQLLYEMWYTVKQKWDTDEDESESILQSMIPIIERNI